MGTTLGWSAGEGGIVDGLQTSASLLLDSSKLLQVDISGPRCTKGRTRTFELAFSLANLTGKLVQLLAADHPDSASHQRNPQIN